MTDFLDGPCMCGGCRSCLHDQGYDCGYPDCKRCADAREDEEGESDE